jgi:hypothetical protein
MKPNAQILSHTRTTAKGVGLCSPTYTKSDGVSFASLF